VLRKEPILTGEKFACLENIPTYICSDNIEASCRAANIIARKINRNNEQGRKTVLGLATGSTPVGVYRELIRMHQQEGLDFSRVVTFNLDEYYPMSADSIQSYHRWMHENFFEHVNVPAENIHIPDGTVHEDNVNAYCREYEEQIQAAGGIDIQLLGIGRTGHIGFNEPGSSRQSRTRLITLDPVTRRDAAAGFFGEANVPRRAITMGVGTILEARQVILLAFGEQKAPIIRRAVEGKVTNAVSASFLQNHPQAEMIIDRGAAAKLTRVDTPWTLGEIEWSAEMTSQAVIWLSLETGKSILKLDQDDYDTHHLASLVRSVGSVDSLNKQVFAELLGAITESSALPQGKRMLVFSPHPDDDVISMGATITRLVEHGNDVNIAYMTSGNIAVADEHARQMMRFWAEMNRVFDIDPEGSMKLRAKARDFLTRKTPGQVDSPEVLEIKTQIRRAEALGACLRMGVYQEQAHFLELPFYQTGQVRKLPITDEDVNIVLDTIHRVRPDWIFMAGELSDPHGTHRQCAEAIFRALDQLGDDERPAVVWLYRGAWQEWEPGEVDMTVPLSKDELSHKIFGIFKHQSQKDKALFPGPYDDREFWQRAEARNTDTAAVYNKLGLPEYYAMEAFVRYGWPEE
jgi:glucosamine-6-phosphate deaminase